MEIQRQAAWLLVNAHRMQPACRVVKGCPLAQAALLPRGTGSRTHSAAERPEPKNAKCKNVSFSANIPISACIQSDAASFAVFWAGVAEGVESGVLPAEGRRSVPDSPSQRLVCHRRDALPNPPNFHLSRTPCLSPLGAHREPPRVLRLDRPAISAQGKNFSLR